MWYKWSPKFAHIVDKLQSWLDILQTKIDGNIPEDIGEPRGFWAYHKTESIDGPYGCRPELSWIWSAPEGGPRRSYFEWQPVDPFFLDENERRWRLVEPMRAERDEQLQAIVKVLNPQRAHSAQFERDGNDLHAHVKAIIPDNEDLTVPDLTEMTEVAFCLKS